MIKSGLRSSFLNRTVASFVSFLMVALVFAPTNAEAMIPMEPNKRVLPSFLDDAHGVVDRLLRRLGREAEDLVERLPHERVNATDYVFYQSDRSVMPCGSKYLGLEIKTTLSPECREDLLVFTCGRERSTIKFKQCGGPMKPVTLMSLYARDFPKVTSMNSFLLESSLTGLRLEYKKNPDGYELKFGEPNEDYHFYMTEKVIDGNYFWVYQTAILGEARTQWQITAQKVGGGQFSYDYLWVKGFGEKREYVNAIGPVTELQKFFNEGFIWAIDWLSPRAAELDWIVKPSASPNFD